MRQSTERVDANRMSASSSPERRQSLRVPYQGVVEIEPQGGGSPVTGEGRDLGEGGVSVRVNERLDLHTVVRMRLTPPRLTDRRAPARRASALQCVGRVAWTTARMDLRAEPPYPYDMGIEFLQVPPFIKRQMTMVYRRLRQHQQAAPRAPRLRAAQIGRRFYVPSLSYDVAPQASWHLIVRIDGVPCYARRFASLNAAVAGWKAFRTEHAAARPRASSARIVAGDGLRQARRRRG